MSFFIGKLNTKSQQLTYINAGHNPPILFYENKFLELINGTTLLGLTENLQNINVEIFNYTSEFTLLCYTDGLTDTVNAINESISIEQVKEIVKNNIKSKPDFINQALLFFIEEFKGEIDFPDDIALLTIKINDLGF